MSDVVVTSERHHCLDTLPYRDRGSIYQCDDCGRYWYASTWETYEASTSWSSVPYWRPVRWFKFRLRRRIRKAERPIIGERMTR